jgi:enoyl-CoA hydratase
MVRTGRIAEIILNRPAKLNAMTSAMAVDLQKACLKVDADDEVRVVIIHGAGDRAFSAGSDINALDDYGGPYEFRNRIDYVTQIRNLRKPCIAAIQGWAMGGGLEMALAADIRIAAESARFGAPEVSLGWVGAGGASQMLPRLAGYGRAMYLLLQGDPIDASKALEWGLIEEVVPEGQEVSRAKEIAGRIAEHSSVATQTVKAAAREALSSSLEAGLRYENELMALSFALGNDEAGRSRFKKRTKTGRSRK